MRPVCCLLPLLLPLLFCACGGDSGADVLQPELEVVAPLEPVAETGTEPVAETDTESAVELGPESATDLGAAPDTETGAALVQPGSDPPMLPPRELDREEELLELVPWKRLDAPPDFEAVVPWQEAHLHLGKRMAVEGRIVGTYNSGRACFLNFAEDWKGKFHGVIFASSFPEYSGAPEDLFLDKQIRLIGKIKEHQGAPQIVVEEPRQIVVLND